tara:strand:- start:260 stop:1264 length:1005 start_codon:yes stop_codon:yes gene_type:complete
MKDLIIISNDNLFIKNKIIYSNYNDTINIIETFRKKNLFIISRKALERQLFQTSSKNIKRLTFLKLFKLNLDNKKILMISITPFNLMVFLILKIFHKKIKGHVLLRSDGFKEYQIKFGLIGRFFYNIAFSQIIKKLNIITVSKELSNLYKSNFKVVTPSELTTKWFKKSKVKVDKKKAKLLYVGRLKKEKGIFSLLKILSKLTNKFSLRIVGLRKALKSNIKNVEFLKETSNINELIKFYDKCNIFILPSFTEGSPKVILESLIRNRPIIIFEDIKYVKKNYKGIHVCKRNKISLENKIKYILVNYKKIQKEMKKNKIPLKRDFQNELRKLCYE